MDILYSLLNNTLSNIKYLQVDFVSFRISQIFFTQVLINILISTGILLTSYLVGEKIKRKIVKNTRLIEYDFLISIGLGYIMIGTGIGILGFLSLFSKNILFIYSLVVLGYSILPFNKSKILLKQLKNKIAEIIKYVNLNKFVSFWLLLFILLALVNLLSPEIREDQYHIDLPKIYLNSQTIMVPPREPIHVSGGMLLSEMYYSIGISLGSQESARYIHFIFYLLVILTLLNFSRIKKHKFSIYAPLIFATAPVVIHESSSMYVDFQWIFCMLLGVLIFISKKRINFREIVVSGILIGGMLATKLWTIVFIPIFIIFLLILIHKIKPKEKFQFLLIFILSISLAPLLWFIRAFLLTGNPVYPAFSHGISLDKTNEYFGIFHYLTINYSILNPFNFINVFSPLFFLGIIFLLYKFKRNVKELLKINLLKLIGLFLLLYVFINYPYGRYLLGLYVLLIIPSSFGIFRILSDFKFSKKLFNFLLFIFYSYYLINSILVLPYSLGIDNKNNYLSRVLIRDNSSYYDYGSKFNKFIKKNDLVATYGIFGYYYAPFNFIDVNFIFDDKNRDFNLLKRSKVTKLFIKDGDINYFCKKISLINCNNLSYNLISSYSGYKTFYLYNIK